MIEPRDQSAQSATASIGQFSLRSTAQVAPDDLLRKINSALQKWTARAIG